MTLQPTPEISDLQLLDVFRASAGTLTVTLP